MEQIKIPLGNGYNLVAACGMDPLFTRDISVQITDKDDVFNQEIVLVSSDYTVDASGNVKYNDEKIRLLVFGDSRSEAHTNKYIIDLYHDSDIDALDEDFDDAEEYELDAATEELDEEEVSAEGADAQNVLEYGDTGEAVKVIQRRLKELGYFGGVIGGNYLTLTKAAVESFQTASGLHVDGVCDEATLEKLMASDAPKMEVSAAPVAGNQEYAITKDWWKSDIQSIFAKGTVATITDVETRLSWKEKRRGGTNHADVMPLTAADTANLKKAYGDKWKWDRRAIWVTINGVTYAASMNGMPHGNTSIKDNNFDGHHCIHFTNSRTHCSDKVCPKHQAAIKKAASVKLA